MSSIIPMEYKVLQKKIALEMYKTLGDDIVHLFIIGSSANSTVFPGVSDVNFVLIIKAPQNLTNPASETFVKIAEIIKNFKDDPIFTTLVAIEIYFETQLPSLKDLGGFSPIKAVALKVGQIYLPATKKFSTEENPMKNYEIDEKQLKNSVNSLIQDRINQITLAFAEPYYTTSEEEKEEIQNTIEGICIESILLCTQAFFIYKERKYVTKVDLSMRGEIYKLDKLDLNFLDICTNKWQGADYAGEFTENEDAESVVSAKQSGIIHKFENIYEMSISFLVTLLNYLN